MYQKSFKQENNKKQENKKNRKPAFGLPVNDSFIIDIRITRLRME